MGAPPSQICAHVGYLSTSVSGRLACEPVTVGPALLQHRDPGDHGHPGQHHDLVGHRGAQQDAIATGAIQQHVGGGERADQEAEPEEQAADAVASGQHRDRGPARVKARPGQPEVSRTGQDDRGRHHGGRGGGVQDYLHEPATVDRTRCEAAR